MIFYTYYFSYRWCDLRAENNTSFSSKSSEILLFFENHYSHVFFIVYDAFIGAEINLRQKGTVAKISSNRLVILEFSSNILLWPSVIVYWIHRSTNLFRQIQILKIIHLKLGLKHLHTKNIHPYLSSLIILY